MITELTPYQHEQIGVILDKWMGYGLSIYPSNHEECEKGIGDLYRIVGYENPIIIWGDSPFEIALMSLLIRSEIGLEIGSKIRSEIRSKIRSEIRSKIGSEIRSEIWSEIGLEIWLKIGLEIRSKIWSEIRSKIGSEIRSEIGLEIRSKIWSKIGLEIRSEIGLEIWSKIRSEIGSKIGLEIWSKIRSEIGLEIRSKIGLEIRSKIEILYWIDDMALYDYYSSVLGIADRTPLLEATETIMKNTPHIIPFEGVCFVSERHTVLSRDGDDNLHSTSGLAVGYADNFGVYAWHGTKVPKEFIMEPMTFDLIMAQENEELRRIMIEIYGEDKFIEALGVDPVDISEWGKLYRVDIGDVEPLVLVRVADPSTDRIYFLQVQPVDDYGDEILTAKHAIAWTFNMREAEYQPLLEA